MLNVIVAVLRLLLPVSAPFLFAWGGAIRPTHETWTWILWGCGCIAILVALLLNEMTISRLQAERLINTAVDFIHAAGATDVRANYAGRSLFRRKHLKIKHYSANYGDAERKNTWGPKDKACAIIALEKGVPVLGGDPNEKLIEKKSIDVLFPIEVRPMVYFNKGEEQIRSLLCCPVRRRGKGHPIGVPITFDDGLTLENSLLTKGPILHACEGAREPRN